MLVSVGPCSPGARLTAPPPRAASCGWSHSRRREKIGSADPLPRLRGHIPSDDEPDRPAPRALVRRLGQNRSRLRTGRGCAEFIMARSVVRSVLLRSDTRQQPVLSHSAHFPAAGGGGAVFWVSEGARRAFLVGVCRVGLGLSRQGAEPPKRRRCVVVHCVVVAGLVEFGRKAVKSYKDQYLIC
jgi:hypothetical protein